MGAFGFLLLAIGFNILEFQKVGQK